MVAGSLESWADCEAGDCDNKYCVWAGTKLCYPCSVKQLGQKEMDHRHKLTRAEDGSWNGFIFEPLLAWVVGSVCVHCGESPNGHGWLVREDHQMWFVCPDGKLYPA